jgi:hypothetical protein
MAQSIKGGSMARLREFVVQFRTEEQSIEHLAGFAGPADLPVPGAADVRRGG